VNPHELSAATIPRHADRTLKTSRQSEVFSTQFMVAIVILLAVWSFGSRAWADAGTVQQSATDADDSSKESETEINKKLSNPISSIWALSLQQNTYWIHPGIDGKANRNAVNLQFQPVTPVALTPNWNLITRPVLQLLNSSPYLDLTGFHRVTGIGDTILASLLSPSPRLAGPWLLGLGPTFIFPTASNAKLGQGMWQIGPAAVLGYLGEKFIVGVFPQQWFSVGGWGPRSTSQLNLQYFANYFLPGGWAIGSSPNMLVDWKASSGNMVTFPIGLSVSKVQKFGRLPIKFQVQGQYMPVSPDVFGQCWDLQFQITPVIPKLIKGDLLEGW
jgi:hypothetical protein